MGIFTWGAQKTDRFTSLTQHAPDTLGVRTQAAVVRVGPCAVTHTQDVWMSHTKDFVS